MYIICIPCTYISSIPRLCIRTTIYMFSGPSANNYGTVHKCGLLVSGLSRQDSIQHDVASPNHRDTDTSKLRCNPRFESTKTVRYGVRYGEDSI